MANWLIFNMKKQEIFSYFVLNPRLLRVITHLQATSNCEYGYDIPVLSSYCRILVLICYFLVILTI